MIDATLYIGLSKDEISKRIQEEHGHCKHDADIFAGNVLELLTKNG